MRRLFITASGTDVGKTFVATTLIAAVRARGCPIQALKPIATGYDPERAAQSDSGRLLAAMGLPVTEETVAAITPWRFAAALSPDMAAARVDSTIPFERVVDFCRVSTAELTLIEGVGGVMVPLDGEHTVLDWIAALGAPVLLVTGSYLGTLSHTLTAAAALEARACELAGVVVSESAEQPVSAAETAGVLARFLRNTPVAVLPRGGTAADCAVLGALVERACTAAC